MSASGSTLITYVDVPQNAFITVKLPRRAIGILVVNEANVTVSVLDDALRPTNPPTPAGLTYGYNYFEGLYSPQVGCLGNYQGNARVYFYDGPVDVGRNPPIAQAVISVVGNVSAVVSGTVSLTAGTQVVIQGNAGVIINNTGPILTIGPSGLWAYIVGAAVVTTVTMTRQSQQVLLQPYINTLSQGGVMTLYAVDPTTTQIVYMLVHEGFQYEGVAPTNLETLPYQFPGNYASGTVLHYAFTGNMGVAIGY